jgi:hypothetical protein
VVGGWPGGTTEAVTPPGAYNVGDDEPVRKEVYAGSLASLLGLRPPRFPPDWATPLFGAPGAMLGCSLRISNRKVRAESGWRPRYPSVREGWAAMLREMKRELLPAGVCHFDSVLAARPVDRVGAWAGACGGVADGGPRAKAAPWSILALLVENVIQRTSSESEKE